MYPVCKYDKLERKRKESNMSLQKGDYIIISVLVLLLIALLIWQWVPSSEEIVTAVVMKDGKEIACIELDREQGELKVDHVTITYGNGKICFSSSDCPDQVCVQTGILSKAGQSAACVPNRILIRVVGGEVDSVVS